MTLIKNPIIPGMAPDPSIIRVNEDYYIATSTFHWNPAVQIFHSKDLINWDLLTQVLNKNEVNLRGTDTPSGIWAPHLSYDSQTEKYWLAYSHMQNMAGREFNADSFAMWSKNITGPWSTPIYLTSIGFDPAIYHENGKHYISILEWETRTGYQAPGHIVISEIDVNSGEIIGKWHRVTTGFTTRGCVEAPQIYKHDDFYYLLIASGGTGYAHGIEIGRSKNIFGPYEPNPTGEPIVTSSPHHLFSLGDPDAGHFEMYNPLSQMQKAGHGSLLQTSNDEWYIAHLMARPLKNTKLNPLGRETSLQKMVWNKDGWLEMADGSNLAKMEVDGPTNLNIIQNLTNNDIIENFNEEYDHHFMTPYHNQDKNWVNTTDNPGSLRIYGANSFFSKMNPSIMATRATSLNYDIETRIRFSPDHYSQAAGVGLYYDSDNWIYAYLGLNDQEDNIVLNLQQAKLGKNIKYTFDEVNIAQSMAKIKVHYFEGNVDFLYSTADENDWHMLGNTMDASYLSDEGVNGTPGEIGGFTGLFNFIGSVDAYQHQSYADFDYYYVTNLASDE